MKKYISILIIFLVSGSFLTSCGQEKDKSKKEVETAVNKIDSLKGKFNPSAAINPSSSHWAVHASFDGQQYTIDTSFTDIRAGKLPYIQEEKTSLPFAVKYYDANGELLGQYSIENPTSLRSCEPGKEAVKPGVISSFEILLPAIEGIQNVQIVAGGKEAKVFQLPPLRREVKSNNSNDKPDSTNVN